MRRIVGAMRPGVEAAIEHTFGSTLLLGRPTPKRLAGWRTKAQTVAAREAGFAYAAYGHLKLSEVAEDIANRIFTLGGGGERQRHERVRQAVWARIREENLNADNAMTAAGTRPDVVLFLRKFDRSYRIRRLRFLARRLTDIEEREAASPDSIELARTTIYDLIGRYSAVSSIDENTHGSFGHAEKDIGPAMAGLADLLDLRAVDDDADMRLSGALATFPKLERRALMLTYLGFPFYDIATLPLLQGEGLDEFDPAKVDRISPEDATGIRAGGAAATLKGIQLNSFGAFFSRAYRENDYLWGRLHGAERLIDIVVSTLPRGIHLPAGAVATLKRDAYRLILAEERPRLTAVASLFDELEQEIGGL